MQSLQLVSLQDEYITMETLKTGYPEAVKYAMKCMQGDAPTSVKCYPEGWIVLVMPTTCFIWSAHEDTVYPRALPGTSGMEEFTARLVLLFPTLDNENHQISQGRQSLGSTVACFIARTDGSYLRYWSRLSENVNVPFSSPTLSRGDALYSMSNLGATLVAFLTQQGVAFIANVTKNAQSIRTLQPLNIPKNPAITEENSWTAVGYKVLSALSFSSQNPSEVRMSSWSCLNTSMSSGYLHLLLGHTLVFVTINTLTGQKMHTHSVSLEEPVKSLLTEHTSPPVFPKASSHAIRLRIHDLVSVGSSCLVLLTAWLDTVPNKLASARIVVVRVHHETGCSMVVHMAQSELYHFPEESGTAAPADVSSGEVLTLVLPHTRTFPSADCYLLAVVSATGVFLFDESKGSVKSRLLLSHRSGMRIVSVAELSGRASESFLVQTNVGRLVALGHLSRGPILPSLEPAWTDSGRDPQALHSHIHSSLSRALSLYSMKYTVKAEKVLEADLLPCRESIVAIEGCDRGLLRLGKLILAEMPVSDSRWQKVGSHLVDGSGGGGFQFSPPSLLPQRLLSGKGTTLRHLVLLCHSSPTIARCLSTAFPVLTDISGTLVGEMVHIPAHCHTPTTLPLLEMIEMVECALLLFDLHQQNEKSRFLEEVLQKCISKRDSAVLEELCEVPLLEVMIQSVAEVSTYLEVLSEDWYQLCVDTVNCPPHLLTSDMLQDTLDISKKVTRFLQNMVHRVLELRTQSLSTLETWYTSAHQFGATVPTATSTLYFPCWLTGPPQLASRKALMKILQVLCLLSQRFPEDFFPSLLDLVTSLLTLQQRLYTWAQRQLQLRHKYFNSSQLRQSSSTTYPDNDPRLALQRQEYVNLRRDWIEMIETYRSAMLSSERDYRQECVQLAQQFEDYEWVCRLHMREIVEGLSKSQITSFLARSSPSDESVRYISVVLQRLRVYMDKQATQWSYHTQKVSPMTLFAAKWFAENGLDAFWVQLVEDATVNNDHWLRQCPPEVWMPQRFSCLLSTKFGIYSEIDTQKILEEAVLNRGDVVSYKSSVSLAKMCALANTSPDRNVQASQLDLINQELKLVNLQNAIPKNMILKELDIETSEEDDDESPAALPVLSRKQIFSLLLRAASDGDEDVELWKKVLCAAHLLEDAEEAQKAVVDVWTGVVKMDLRNGHVHLEDGASESIESCLLAQLLLLCKEGNENMASVSQPSVQQLMTQFSPSDYSADELHKVKYYLQLVYEQCVA